MWIVVPIGVGIVVLAHTAPAPFVLDAMAGDRAVWAHAARRASHRVPHLRKYPVRQRPSRVLFGGRQDTLLDQPIDLLLPDQVRAAHHQHRAAYFAAPTTRPMG